MMNSHTLSHQYDYYGEFKYEESSPTRYPISSAQVNHVGGDNYDGSEMKQNSGYDTLNQSCPEDSLMEFINDYFQGNVTNDFSDQDSSQVSDAHVPEKTHAFNYSSSSDMNTSIEMFSSRENSVLYPSDLLTTRNEPERETDPAALQTEETLYSARRKSISYDILFMNSKDDNGRVKIQIIPNEKPSRDRENSDKVSVELLKKSELNHNDKVKGWTVQDENLWLRKQVADLERKLHCLEAESERVVGELSKILEKKNEVISELELQVAGIRTKS